MACLRLLQSVGVVRQEASSSLSEDQFASITSAVGLMKEVMKQLSAQSRTLNSSLTSTLPLPRPSASNNIQANIRRDPSTFVHARLNIWEWLQLLENLPLIAEGTKEVVSYALESTCFELKTLMEYYTSSADQETYARLKTARLT
ncbi:hypothetical protein DAPPUDRAFT_269265 [Daphnia pulex]|uniref:Uncharacterized protein n=1 Tax=Daphnia pulex TaxID=6669 RepID=E9HZ34_DAPPU|nr:hypothetical protein DAPPUDRAFT_269265 [Daphnia pulex]|eukprot:EFX62996.1 hypothetical protein DAPPUDRAFT_269265 [Daphnia pulex]